MIKEFLRGFGSGVRLFSETISIIVNCILLTLVYLIGVGITSISAKIFKKKFLDLNPTNEESYWEDVEKKDMKMEDHYRQF